MSVFSKYSQIVLNHRTEPLFTFQSSGKVHNTLNIYIQNIYVEGLMVVFYFWYSLYNWFGKILL